MLFVGRFAEGKRPWLAVEAFAEVLDEYPDAELYLCGNGALREDLEVQVAELGIGDAVTFLGHVPYDEMPKVYRSGDVLVLPSRAEGVPRTVLEAMASDVPPVVSDLKQIVPLIGGAGVTVSDSSDEFDVGLKIALEGDVSGVRGQVARQFNWANTVDRTTNALSRL